MPPSRVIRILNGYELPGIKALFTKRGTVSVHPPLLALVAVAALVLGGCARGEPEEARPAGTPLDASSGPPAAPKGSPADAARALLEAEQAGDHDASFLFLSAEGRKVHASSADWARRRQELPPITKFEIEQEKNERVIALVEHQPGLDPFIGLSPARERQTWTARQAQGGWLLDPEPQIEMLLPPATAAKEPAVAWASALQRCDENAARGLQVVGTLFGISDAPGGLCRSAGTITADSPRPLPPGPASQELVAQYGTEVFEWATAVPITAPVRPFHLVLAPIGDTWQVLGLFES